MAHLIKPPTISLNTLSIVHPGTKLVYADIKSTQHTPVKFQTIPTTIAFLSSTHASQPSFHEVTASQFHLHPTTHTKSSRQCPSLRTIYKKSDTDTPFIYFPNILCTGVEDKKKVCSETFCIIDGVSCSC